MMSDTKYHNINQLKAANTESEPELTQHILVQLKSSYNQLLEEPLPENIKKLLVELSNRENNS